MSTKNTDATRFYSDIHEKSVCRALEAKQQSNSGAGLYKKGDVLQPKAKLLIECKTCLADKESFSIKKDWILKNKLEMQEMHLDYSALAFNFGPNQANYYIIDEMLMKYLVEKLIEDNN